LNNRTGRNYNSINIRLCQVKTIIIS
jgi:hypothetical protein